MTHKNLMVLLMVTHEEAGENEFTHDNSSVRSQAEFKKQKLPFLASQVEQAPCSPGCPLSGGAWTPASTHTGQLVLTGGQPSSLPQEGQSCPAFPR